MEDQVQAAVVVALAAEPVIVERLDYCLLLAAYQFALVLFFGVKVAQQVHHRSRNLRFPPLAMTRRRVVVVEARVEPLVLVIEVNVLLLRSVVGRGLRRRRVELLKVKKVFGDVLGDQAELWSDGIFDFVRKLIAERSIIVWGIILS